MGTPLKMKDKLAVFDLDGTLVNHFDLPEAHKVLYSDGKLPDFWNAFLNEWEGLRWHKIQVLNDRHLTRNQVWKILEELSEHNEALIDGMDKVVKFLAKDHDIILLSDNDTLNCNVFLTRVGLRKYFTHVFSRKCIIQDDGQILFEPVPKITCPYGGHFLCKGQVVMDFIKDKDYQKVSYFGDGGNDFCPATKLSENDSVFPRKNYDLDRRIQNNGQEIKAKVQTWMDGNDLLSYL